MLCSNGISMNDEQMMTEHKERKEQGIMGNGYTSNISRAGEKSASRTESGRGYDCMVRQSLSLPASRKEFFVILFSSGLFWYVGGYG
jgi:hypothetical protein